MPFERQTVIPLLVNTSLNSVGKPIANTPADAVNMGVEMDANAFAAGSYLVRLD